MPKIVLNPSTFCRSSQKNFSLKQSAPVKLFPLAQVSELNQTQDDNIELHKLPC